MKPLIILAFISVATATNIQIDQLEYGFCEGAAEPLELLYFDIQPFPIIFRTHRQVQVQGGIILNEEIPVGAQVRIDITKEGLIPIPIPCIEDNQWGFIGSCTYDGNEWLQMFSNFLCPELDEPCELPFSPGKYSTGADPTIIVLPEIPDIIADLFGGTYTMEMHIDLMDGTEMTCIYMRVEIETTLM